MKVTVNANEAVNIGRLAADVFSREIPKFWEDDALNALSGFELEHIGKKKQPDTLERFVAGIMGQADNAAGVTELTFDGPDDRDPDGRGPDAGAKNACQRFEDRVVAAFAQHHAEFEKGVKAEAVEILENLGWLPD